MKITLEIPETIFASMVSLTNVMHQKSKRYWVEKANKWINKSREKAGVEEGENLGVYTDDEDTLSHVWIANLLAVAIGLSDWMPGVKFDMEEIEDPQVQMLAKTLWGYRLRE